MSKEKARAKRLLDNFKLTIEDWDKIATHQQNLCAICGRPSQRPGQRLATDHSHLTGLIRGLLCHQCNPILGKLENAFIRLGLHKVDGLTVALVADRLSLYLRQPPASVALGRDHYGYPGKIGTKAHRKRLKKEAKITTPTEPLTQGKRRK